MVKDIDGDGVIRVACVGDSITAGTSEYNYPKYLAEYLKALGSKTGVRYEVKNHGKGAASVRHVREKVDVNGCAHQVQSSNSSRRARRIVV